MPGWRGICDFARDIRELVRGDWLFMWFLAPVTGYLLALILWFSGLEATVAAIAGSDRWTMLTHTPQGLAIIFGFAALTVGHMFNAWLTRRRDDRLREQEARALASILAAELATAWGNAQNFLVGCQNFKNTAGEKGLPRHRDDAAANWLPEFQAVAANLTRMGILGAELDAMTLGATAGLRGQIQVALLNAYISGDAALPEKAVLAGVNEWADDVRNLVNILRARAGLRQLKFESAYRADAEQDSDPLNQILPDPPGEQGS